MNALKDGADAAEADEEMMPTPQLLWLWTASARAMSPPPQKNAAEKAGEREGREQQTASFTHACSSLSTHDGADLLDGWGEGMRRPGSLKLLIQQ